MFDYKLEKKNYSFLLDFLIIQGEIIFFFFK